VKPPASARTILDVLAFRAEAQREQAAFLFLEEGEVESARLTFGELHARHRAIAAALRAADLAGQRVLLFYLPGLDFVAAFMGCLAAGVIPVAVPPPMPTERTQRIQAIVEDAHAAAIVTVTPLMPMLQAWLAQSERLARMTLIPTDTVGAEGGAPLPAPDVHDVAFLQYTSGSTRLPRGVMVSHANLMANLACIQGPIELGSDSVSVTWLPCFHDMGLINGVIEPIYVGCLSVMMSPLAFIRKPRRWLEAISKYRATHSGAPNFAYDLCVRKISAEDRQGMDLASWRQAYLSAEPIRRDTMDRFHDAFAPQGFRRRAFYPCYGLAEATLAVTGGSLEDEPVSVSLDGAALEQGRAVIVPAGTASAMEVVGCGRAGLDTEVIVVDPETRRRAQPGLVGEVWVKGPGVARGYFNRPDESQATFAAQLEDGGGPYVRTGDLAFFRGDELFVVGRLKDVIIIRGRNHHPHDIEWSVGQVHPAVRAGCAAAFVVKRGGEEKLLVAQEVQQELPRAEAEELVGRIREAVAEQHGLKLHEAVLVGPGGIPRTSSGKIQRSLCRTMLENGQLDVVARG
jgi:acyl-CoA synthetase (AMP-forming)/AMP-acid ligase II